MSDFTAQWKKAKTVYEKATDEKKPSKTFLGIRTGAGLEEPMARLDKPKDAKDAVKAVDDLWKATLQFKPLLEKRVKETAADKVLGPKIKAESTKLEKALTQINRDADVRVVEAVNGFLEKALAKDFAMVETMKMDKVLSDPVWLHKMKEFCAKEASTENIDFLVAVKGKMQPKVLFETFVSTKAKRQVNLPGDVLKLLCKDAKKTEMVDKPDFAKANKVITDLMQTDTMRRFRPWAQKKLVEEGRKKLGLKE